MITACGFSLSWSGARDYSKVRSCVPITRDKALINIDVLKSNGVTGLYNRSELYPALERVQQGGLQAQDIYHAQLGAFLNATPDAVFQKFYDANATPKPMPLTDIIRDSWKQIVALSASNTEFVLETENRRKNLAVICSQVSRLTHAARSTAEELISASDVLRVLGATRLPVLNSNKHQK